MNRLRSRTSARDRSRPEGALRVRALDVRLLDTDVIAAWRDLELRCLEPNVYLSPHFVLPALRYLDPHLRALALVAEKEDPAVGPSRLVGMLVGHVTLGERTFPVPHFVAYKSKHSYLTGFLLDREHASDALTALLEFIRARSPRWHGVEFEATWGDGPTHDLLAAACERMGMVRQEWNGFSRAVLFPRRDRERIQAAVLSETHQLRRRIRRLNEQGQVRWSIAGANDDCRVATDTFLELEHQGWKGEGGSSLRSTAAGEAFFRTMAAGFGSANRALFAELSLNDRVIASTSNFVSGQSGFAFKIGWLPEFRQLSPGLQAELRLMQGMATDERLTSIDFWDSGAEEGSYIERLWPTRRPLVSMALGSSWVGGRTLRLVQTARAARRQWRHRAAAGPTTAEVDPR